MSCVTVGLTRFFGDLGVGLFQIPGVLSYLNLVRSTYEENRPDPADFLAKIEQKGILDAIEGDATQVIFAMGLITLMLIIASIAFCVTFLVSIYVLAEPMYAIVSLTVYLVFVVFLYYLSRYLFASVGRAIQIPSFEEEFDAYFTAQQRALNKALCVTP